MGIRSRRVAIAAVGAGALVLFGVATAAGKTLRSQYDVNGWSASVQSKGLCLQSLTCPAVKTSTSPYPTAHASSLAGVGAATTTTFTSAPFKYEGASARQPQQVTFRLFRRTNDAAFLNVAGSDAYFNVSVLNARNGATVQKPFHNTALTPTVGWSKEGPVDLARNALRRGQSYEVQIATTFVNGAQVIPSASAEYKNVRIVAKRHLKRHQH